MSNEQNIIFIDREGFAYGAIASLVTDTIVEMKIPAATEIDFEGKCRLRVDGRKMEGAVPLARRDAPYWHVTFTVDEDDVNTA